MIKQSEFNGMPSPLFVKNSIYVEKIFKAYCVISWHFEHKMNDQKQIWSNFGPEQLSVESYGQGTENATLTNFSPLAAL